MKLLLSVLSFTSAITAIAILHTSKATAQFSIPSLPDIIEEQIEEVVPEAGSTEEALPNRGNAVGSREYLADDRHPYVREIIDSPAWVYETSDASYSPCLLDYNDGGEILVSESGRLDSSDGTTLVTMQQFETPYDDYPFQPRTAVPKGPISPGSMAYNVVVTVVSDELAEIGGSLWYKKPGEEWKVKSDRLESLFKNNEGRIALRYEWDNNGLDTDTEYRFRVNSDNANFVTGDYSISIVDMGEYVLGCDS